MFDALHESDPLADAAVDALFAEPKWFETMGRAEVPKSMPESIRALTLDASQPLAWVDYERCDRAGSLLFRSGIAGGIVLGARSLVAGYAAPAGNKPLAFSGRLTEKVQHRLAETSRFVVATCSPRGLRPGGDGWGITLRVRMMHARVRQMLLRSPRWDSQAWGLPINQHDTVATSLLFSTVFIEGIRQFGVPVSVEEEEDYLHLWRVSGWLIGAEPSLLPTSSLEARRLEELVGLTQHAPDEDSAALTNALLESPRITMSGKEAERHVALGRGFARALLGEQVADGLGLPKDEFRHVVPAINAIVRASAPFVPRAARGWFENYGKRYWQQSIDIGLGGLPAAFQMPRSLAGRS